MSSSRRYLEAVKSTLRNFALRTPVERATKGVLELLLDPLLDREEVPTGLSVYHRLSPDPNKFVVLWGAQDSIHVPALGAQALAQAVPGVSISYVLDCGHALHLESPGQVASLVQKHIIKFLANDHPAETVVEFQGSETDSVQPEKKPTEQVDMAAERLKVAEELVECLNGPHRFGDVLRALNNAKAIKLEGMLVEEVAMIVLFQSRARLLNRAVQMCVEFDDMPSLAKAIDNARSWFLKSVQAYAPCHCQECSHWALELESLETYVSLKAHAKKQVWSMRLSLLCLCCFRSCTAQHLHCLMKAVQGPCRSPHSVVAYFSRFCAPPTQKTNKRSRVFLGCSRFLSSLFPFVLLVCA
jgi:hypothetical protein